MKVVIKIDSQEFEALKVPFNNGTAFTFYEVEVDDILDQIHIDDINDYLNDKDCE